MTADDLTQEARKWLGVRWRHQGRDRQGLDCVGLLLVIAQALGAHPEDLRNYGRRPGSAPLYRELLRYCDEVPLRDRQPGDILVLSMAGEDPQHVLLLTAAGTVIHASAQHRKVVEHRLDQPTLTRITKAFRFRGLTHG